jgi:hypothetical protein
MICSSVTIAQRYRDTGRHYDDDYDAPLASGEVVGKSLLAALAVGFVGYLLFKLSDSLKDGQKETETSTNVGCLGTVFIGGAFLCLVPLLFWIQAIVNSVIVVVLLGGAIIYVASLVIGAIKK